MMFDLQEHDHLPDHLPTPVMAASSAMPSAAAYAVLVPVTIGTSA